MQLIGCDEADRANYRKRIKVVRGWLKKASADLARGQDHDALTGLLRVENDICAMRRGIAAALHTKSRVKQ